MSVSVILKWGSQTFNLECPSPVSGLALKTLISSSTSVPTERQKLMCRVWKGVLKDEADVSLDAGALITLMGSAETIVKPTVPVRFAEDAPAGSAAAGGSTLPAGLSNLGNTCYANATLQCIRSMSGLRDSIIDGRAASANAALGLRAPLRDVFTRLDSSAVAVRPDRFLSALVSNYPKFGERTPGANGGPMQHDADEFLTDMLESLGRELNTPTESAPRLLSLPMRTEPANIVDSLLGLSFEEEITCVESPEEPVVRYAQGARKLICNIGNIEGGAVGGATVNHLHEGITLGLSSSIEKTSSILGRSARWNSKRLITRLPKFLVVQMMRFFWKTLDATDSHRAGGVQGVPCKILKPVSFPVDKFDVLPFCGGALRSTLTERRAAAIKASDAALRAADGSKSTPAMDVDPDLAEALRLSLASESAPSAAGTAEPIFGPSMPATFQGNYNLCGIVRPPCLCPIQRAQQTFYPVASSRFHSAAPSPDRLFTRGAALHLATTSPSPAVTSTNRTGSCSMMISLRKRHRRSSLVASRVAEMTSCLTSSFMKRLGSET